MCKKLIVSALLTLMLHFYVQAQYQLSVTVQNIKKETGNIKLSLYNDAAGFPHKQGVIKGGVVAVNGTTETYVFKNLTKGRYAIALYHDENGNNVMDKNILGIPKEPYGFSNNVKPKMAAPKFNECSFTLNKSAQISINLIP